MLSDQQPLFVHCVLMVGLTDWLTDLCCVVDTPCQLMTSDIDWRRLCLSGTAVGYADTSLHWQHGGRHECCSETTSRRQPSDTDRWTNVITGTWAARVYVPPSTSTRSAEEAECRPNSHVQTYQWGLCRHCDLVHRHGLRLWSTVWSIRLIRSA